MDGEWRTQSDAIMEKLTKPGHWIKQLVDIVSKSKSQNVDTYPL